MADTTIVHGVYTPTYITGGHHPVLKLGQLATQPTGTTFPPTTCPSHLQIAQVTSAEVQYFPPRTLKVGGSRGF